MDFKVRDEQYFIDQYKDICENHSLESFHEYDVKNEEDRFIYFKILGMSRIKDVQNSVDLFSRIYTGLYGSYVPFSYIIKGTTNQIELYFGTDEDAVDMLYRLLFSVISDFHTSIDIIGDKKYYQISEIVEDYTYESICKGIPCKREEDKENQYFIDELINGMQGKRFVFRVDAKPLSINSTQKEYKKWSNLYDESMKFAKRQVSYANGTETVSYEKNQYLIGKFAEQAEKYCENYEKMEKIGGWITTVRHATFSNDDLDDIDKDILSGIVLSSLSGNNDVFERMHVIDIDRKARINQFLSETISGGVEPVLPKYSNFYSSEELAMITLLPRVDHFGFSVKETVNFELSGRDSGNLSLGKIVNSGIITSNEYRIDINDFNRHCFVSGLTGSGKTNTIKSLLIGMKNTSPKIKYLLIEPAKKEYWQLYNAGFDDIKVYTVGSQDGLEYRLNIFERIGNIPIQTHIDYVLAAFKASFIMYTPMPYVLERAIYSIYEDCGWDIVQNENRFGMIYPTLDNLYYKIPLIVDEMGYEDKIQQDLIGSLQARINSMRIGTKGKTLNVRRSTSINELLVQNVIVELEDIADDEVKAFIISLILTQLMEYRLQQEDSQTELKHILLFEEAHRLLKNVQGGTGESADPRGNAVDFFCNMLAELRSKGQGFIIADQIPSKLAPDIVKNTNIKIAHRIVDGEERHLIGNSMHMNDTQIDYLSSLKQGYSAIYAEGDDRPKLVKTPYAGDYIKTSFNRNEVLARIKEANRSILTNEKVNVSEVCARCNNENCDGRRSISILTDDINKLIKKVVSDCQNMGVNNHYMNDLIRMLKHDYFECFDDDYSRINCFFNELMKEMNMKSVDASKFIDKYYRSVIEHFYN